jgi:hypothetical protein
VVLCCCLSTWISIAIATTSYSTPPCFSRLAPRPALLPLPHCAPLHHNLLSLTFLLTPFTRLLVTKLASRLPQTLDIEISSNLRRPARCRAAGRLCLVPSFEVVGVSFVAWRVVVVVLEFVTIRVRRWRCDEANRSRLWNAKF